MTTILSAIKGIMPPGAEAFHERLRWAAAERRWRTALPTQAPHPTTPPSASPPQGIRLRQGARLGLFTDAATRHVDAFRSSRKTAPL